MKRPKRRPAARRNEFGGENLIQQRLRHAARHSTQRDIEFLQAAATEGVGEAQILLAKKYHSGIGIQRDYRSAENLYLSAVRQGEVDAKVHLNRMFVEYTKRAKARARAERNRSGIGVELDYRPPEQLLRAARKSESDAKRHLKRGNVQAAKMKKAIVMVADATYRLERMYRCLGTLPSGRTAPKRIKKAAEKERPAANRKLVKNQTQPGKAMCKRKNNTIRRDYRSTEELYLSTIRQGRVDAMYHLEGMFIEDAKRARARAEGESCRLLAKKYRSIKTVQLEYRSRKQLLHVARQLDSDARYHLRSRNLHAAEMEKSKASVANALYQLERIYQGLGIARDRPRAPKGIKKSKDIRHLDINRKQAEKRNVPGKTNRKPNDRYPRNLYNLEPGSTGSAHT